MSRTIARRYLVSGRVQGVGYRYFARTVARTLKISGWARNRADGNVEVYGAGAGSALEDFEARLRQGPPMSDVRGVEVFEVDVDDTIEEFQIR